jgi:hypothetical protein
VVAIFSTVLATLATKLPMLDSAEPIELKNPIATPCYLKILFFGHIVNPGG